MKKLVSLALALTMTAAMPVPSISAADTALDSIYVYTTISDGTGLVLTQQPVEVTDIDNDGVLTINDTLYCAHETYYEGGAAAGYSSSVSDYGLKLDKLWGIENGGSYGYYVNNTMAMSLSDTVNNNAHVNAYVYSDTKNYSDTYCYFWNDNEFVKSGDELSLTLSYIGFDENWNAVSLPLANAEITVDGVKTGVKTDENGEASITVETDTLGTLVISAVSDEKTLVPPVCTAWVCETNTLSATDKVVSIGTEKVNGSEGTYVEFENSGKFFLVPDQATEPVLALGAGVSVDAEADYVETVYNGEPLRIIRTFDKYELSGSKNVSVTISDGTGLVLTAQPVAVTDIDSDGALTINDALYCAHETYYEGGAAAGYASSTSTYGLMLNKLWGIENGGSYGYYLNDSMAMGLGDKIYDGDRINAFVYSDTKNYSDTYCYFLGGDRMTAKVGDTKNLTLYRIAFDENYSPVSQPVENAEITIDGVKTGIKTDENGKAELTFDHGGSFTVSAVSDELTLVPPVLSVDAFESAAVTTTTAIEETTTTTTTAAPTTTTTAPPTSYDYIPYGDVNNDNEVNISDVIFLNKWLNDNSSVKMTERGKIHADCYNPKGGTDITMKDSEAILQCIVENWTLPYHA